MLPESIWVAFIRTSRRPTPFGLLPAWSLAVPMIGATPPGSAVLLPGKLKPATGAKWSTRKALPVPDTGWAAPRLSLPAPSMPRAKNSKVRGTTFRLMATARAGSV